jgi:type I restriction enzyme S subunit
MKSISNEISTDYSRTILHGNEVLVNVRGTLGGVFAVDKFMKGWNISREVAMIPVNTDFINPKFVAFYIATNSSQRWLTSVKKGAAYVGINLEDLRQFSISFPSLHEQNLIVDKLSDFEIKIKNLEGKYIEKLRHLQMLKQSFFDDFLSKDKKSYL